MMQDLWKSFETTGNIEHYLNYKQDEKLHQKISNSKRSQQNITGVGDTEI